ncbi:MAG TPA: hypothetical protein VF545_00390 [Thermoleophilaceae bacterium]
MPRRARRSRATVACAVLALAAPAAAHAAGTASVDPNVAGKASTATIDVSFDDSGGQNPDSVVVRVARGFKFDPRAVAEKCDKAHAQGNDCPAKSKIGTGTSDLTVSSTNGLFPPTKTTAALELFLAPKLQSGDIAGVVAHYKEASTGRQGSITGRIVAEASGTFGLDARFDDIRASLAPPEGFNVHLDRLRASFGAHRTVKKKVKGKHGKKKVKKIRRNLIRNPKTCAGSWPYEIVVDQNPPESGSAACSSS